ncbi:MAG: carboxypeptidase regulatory-like domain-containing protein [Acidobacteria bacterium]|nr:carboxypeptidase regulatory-like domain-containing protein [Acidobacteriota bacterium]
MMRIFPVLLLAAVLTGSLCLAQQPGTLRGQVTDSSGASVPGASVTATGSRGMVKVGQTAADGTYTIAGLPSGTYTVRGLAKGFAIFERAGVEIRGSAVTTLNMPLAVTLEKQQVTVTDQARVEVDPSQNAGALVLKGEDLDALSDDPDDLQSDLQALAGPAAGPNGGQIFIDGFTGGRLPPKESIREVRVNSNPFSSEYDKPGFGRIEILTKPGSDKFHGQASFTYGDDIFNSRNPFSTNKPPYSQKMFSGNLSGPVTKKSSFFVDVEKRDVNEAALVNATVLDTSFNPSQFQQSFLQPQVRTSVSPRFDYQLSSNHTLVGRYSWATTTEDNAGVGGFSLPGQGTHMDNTQQTVQVTETAVLNSKAINETRFQYMRARNSSTGNNGSPTVSVTQAFTTGGTAIGLSLMDEDRYELQNSTSITHGRHYIKFGVRVRGVNQSNQSDANFNGRFTFATFDAYRITTQGLASGLSLDQIRTLGGGPYQFSLNAGNPVTGVNQVDVGGFLQDDWRIRPSFTLSTGLRYEGQTNIGDHRSIAPRVGFAWGIGKGSGQFRQPLMVLRGGWGMFYDRFSEDLVLNSIRLNGINQQQFVVQYPNFYPNVPDAATLAANRLPHAVTKLDANLRAPYMMQSAIGVERQLPKNITLSLTLSDTRGVHQLYSRNINAPLPGTFVVGDRTSGVRPYGNAGDIYLYQSDGVFRQRQLIVNSSARVSSKVTLFGFYVYGHANSLADGASDFPANTYNTATDWGRARFDTRHRFVMGGSVTAPWKLRLSPFIHASTGGPFDIVVGRDLNGDNQLNDRPALATSATLAQNLVQTRYGNFDLNPGPGAAVIPRNVGEAPGQFSLNLRLSRTFGWGEPTSRQASPSSPDAAGGPPAGSPRGGGMRGGPGGGGGRGGGGGGGMRGGGGHGGMFGGGGESSGRKYSLTLGVSARNALNNVNYGAPSGSLTGPQFGVSRGLAGGFMSSGSANRMVTLQLRFAF